MPTVMKLWGAADGSPTPGDGQYLKDFDFEADAGRGEITLTADIKQAKRFGQMADAIEFYRTSPKCKPLRPDGRPNRPLTATNWEFLTAPEDDKL